MAWLEANHKLPMGEYQRAFNAKFGRDISKINLNALRKRKGWKTGRTGQFKKGLVPHNKGKPFLVAATHPNCRKTQFKKGGLPHNTNYLGHERLAKGGYVEISIAEANPHTGFERRYVLKHRWLWEQANGPVPEGMFLKCLDGNRTNTDPSNWELLPRAVLPYLNGHRGLDYDAAEPEVKPAILTVAKVRHAVRKSREAA